jgi:hypothetical protein
MLRFFAFAVSAGYIRFAEHLAGHMRLRQMLTPCCHFIYL